MSSAGTIKKQTILIVDDSPDNIALLSALLKDQYRVRIATTGSKALQIAADTPPPDLILLDVMMPDLDGYETCRQLKADPRTADIPVIFLTARIQIEDEELGFQVGAVDYITKPISPRIVLARVGTHLSLKNARKTLLDQGRQLERQSARIQDAVTLMMATLARTPGGADANHLRRIQSYVAELARHLQTDPRFSAALAGGDAGSDPGMIDGFLALEKRFREIASQFPDEVQ